MWLIYGIARYNHGETRDTFEMIYHGFENRGERPHCNKKAKFLSHFFDGDSLCRCKAMPEKYPPSVNGKSPRGTMRGSDKRR